MRKEYIIKQKADPKRLKEYIEEVLTTAEIPDSKMFTINLSTLFEPVEAPDVKIAITPLAWTKILTLVMGSDKEIAWHGYVIEKDGRYLITDIMVYPQQVSAATVDADEKRYTEWMMSFKENVKSIRMQGHSHVNMGTSPSGTDLSYYDELVRQVQDYYLFMIINKRGDIHWRFYNKRSNILYLDLNYEIFAYNKFFSLSDWYTSQLEKVTTYTYKYTPTPATSIKSRIEDAYDEVYHREYPT